MNPPQNPRSAARQIVIFSEDFPPYPGGIAQWAFGMAHGLRGLGHDVRVFTRDRGEGAADPLPFPVQLMQGKHWKRRRSWYWWRAIKKYHQENGQADVLIATTWNVARGLIPFARKKNIPVITIIHGLEVTRRMPLLKRLWLKRTLMMSDRVVAVSAFTKEKALADYGISPEKTVVLPNGVNPAHFFPGADTTAIRQRLGLRDEKIILTLARVIERKGHAQVIKALPKVKEKIPRLKYLIAGPWDDACYRQLQTLIAKLHLQNDVLFTGYVAPEEVNQLYNLCNVYVMPSRELRASGDTEGFGITFLEANACGKPVIGGRSGGVVDAIVDGETGFLINPESTEEIAEKLILLLANAALAQQMGRQGRQRVEQQFSWEAISQNLASILFDEKGSSPC
jgi:phosphatidylinositol alpha-1,6-mannosyltransferase